MTNWAYGNTPLEPRWVEYSGAEGDVLKPGHGFCFNHDAATANDQEYQVETPSWSNIYYPAGVMTDAKGEITVDSTGKATIEIVPLGAPVPGVEVWTDQNCAAGDLLELVPGSRIFKKFVGFNQPLVRCNQTVDRSSTAGTVRGAYGFLQVGTRELAEKFAHAAIGPNDQFGVSEAEFSPWLATLIDGGGDNAEVLGAFSSGRWITTTNDADNDLNNLQTAAFMSLEGRSCLFRVVAFQISDFDDTDWFIGLAPTDATIIAGIDDRLGFGQDAGDTSQNLNLYIEKNGTTTTYDTGTDIASATSVTLAFHYDGDKDVLSVWLNDTLLTAPAVTNVPDDLYLAPSIEIRNAEAAAKSLSFTRAFWGNSLT